MNTEGNTGKLSRMPNQPKTPIRGIRIPNELWEQAQRYAATDGITVSEIVRRCLENYVEESQKGGNDA